MFLQILRAITLAITLAKSPGFTQNHVYCYHNKITDYARSGLDRTPYKGHRPVSFVSYHTRAISMGIVKADAYTVFYASISAKAKLCRLQERRGDNPTPGVGPDAGSRGCA